MKEMVKEREGGKIGDRGRGRQRQRGREGQQTGDRRQDDATAREFV
jgi:hypothetical protein